MASTKMTKEEREAFVADVRIAVVSVAEDGKGPVTAPVWYSYEPGGDIRFVTGRDSVKGKLIAEAGRIGFCVQTETPPYKYVSIEGPVRIEKPDFERDQRGIAVRYLGERGGEQYIARSGASPDSDGSIVVILTPETWRTVDYGKGSSLG
jgi:nitroimidazol reductase NimA-like FMN-containing flavoprotein (pyridoxamine 5'-phosphate oxidase superfamily)